jgi:hypothetical protein
MGKITQSGDLHYIFTSLIGCLPRQLHSILLPCIFSEQRPGLECYTQERDNFLTTLVKIALFVAHVEKSLKNSLRTQQLPSRISNARIVSSALFELLKADIVSALRLGAVASSSAAAAASRAARVYFIISWPSDEQCARC